MPVSHAAHPHDLSLAFQDVAVAGVCLMVSLAVTFNGGITGDYQATSPNPIIAVALVVASTAPLAVRRRYPIEVFALTAAATALLSALVYPIGFPIGPGVALYTIATQRVRARLTTVRVITVTAAGFAAYAIACAWSQSAVPWSEMFHSALLGAALWFAGERTRLQSEQIDELKRDAAVAHDLAAAQERTRIARDLHDSVGHAINIIAVRAGAARLRHHDDPDRSLAALTAIEELARHTAADIDHFVGALRSDRDGPAPLTPHSLASVETLVDLHRDAGLVVTSRRTGTALPTHPAVDQAAFRIVQEALTNASRHGTGSADLAIHCGDDAIAIEVRNPASGPGIGPTGHGLIGAAERAHQLGGSMHTTCENGEFVLRAELPYTTAPLAHPGRRR